MAQIVVDRSTSLGTMAWKPSAYGVQRFLRQNMNSTERAVAVGLMDDLGMDLITVHLGGGYSNATSSTQQWAARDVMPSVGSYVWDTVGSRVGLDQLFGYLDELRAFQGSAKMLLVLHDFPVAMLGGQTRASQTNFPWPSATEWQKMGPLLSTIDSRYPGKVWGVSYGQELKGFSNRTDTTALNAFADGYNEVASYVRSNLSSWKLCYPHVNLFATWSTIGERHSEVDGLLAGGNFGSDDETIYNTLLPAVSANDVDYLTVDYSLIDYSTSDTHTYAQAQGLITAPYHVLRRLNEMQDTHWGVRKPIIAIEAYFDVRVADVDYTTEPQKAALTTAMSLEFARAGGTYEMRWEPHGGTPGSETTDGDMICWWDENGVAYDLATYHTALRNAIPDASTLRPVATDSTDIIALASDSLVYFINLGASSTTARLMPGETTAAIGAYGWATATISGTLLAADTFTRSTLGSADIGGSWTSGSGTGAYGANGSALYTSHTGTTQTRRAALGSAPCRNAELLCQIWTDKLASGANQEQVVILRQLSTGDDNFYGANVVFTTSAGVNLAVVKRVSGAQTDISGPIAVSGVTHAADRKFWVRLRVTDNGSLTTLKAKLWQDGSSEPASWTIETTDNEGTLLATGYPGIRAYNGASANTPNTFYWDNFTVTELAADGAPAVVPTTWAARWRWRR